VEWGPFLILLKTSITAKILTVLSTSRGMAEPRHNFVEKQLSTALVLQAPEWFEQYEDKMALVGLPTTLDTGSSVENQVKEIKVKVEKAESKLTEREALESIAVKDRNNNQKEALKNMTTAKQLAESVRTTKTDLRDYERKQEELKRKVREVTEYIQQTVSQELWGDFKEKRDEHAGNAHKQVIEGVKAIKSRLMIAPHVQMSAVKDQIHDLTKTVAVTVKVAREKLAKIDRIKKDSKALQDFLGLDSGSLTDEEAKSAASRGIRHKDGEGTVTQPMQEKLDLQGDKKTWKEFYDELKGMMEAYILRSSVDGDKEIEDGENGASTHAAFHGKSSATTLSVQKSVQQQVNEAVALALQTQTNQNNTFAFNAQQQYAFNAGLQHQATWQQGRGSGWGRRGGRDGGHGRGGGRDGRGRGGRSCWKFQTGECARGDQCKFDHIMDGGANPPNCSHGKACTDKDCKYAHPNGKNDRPGTPVGGKRK
jgi:hypothetical protein